MNDPTVLAGVTIAEDNESKETQALAAMLADAFDVVVKTVHVDADPVAGPRETPHEALAGAIAARVPADHILVIGSANADRWRSRHSVAEHLIDAHQSTTAVVGPRARTNIDGPIIIALDGSANAQAALIPAAQLAAAIGQPIVLTRVIPEGLHESSEMKVTEATAALETSAGLLEPEAKVVVVASNDPVSALVQVSSERQASFLALASMGDREIARTTMGRTAAGLVAEAPCPVYIVRSGDGRST